MGEKVRLLLLYVMALAPGVVLTAVGLFGRWESSVDAGLGHTAAPASEIAHQIWQASTPAEPSPAAPPPAVARDPQKIARGSSTSTCTDLRALFGLGEALTEEQKLYLQEHC